MVKFILTGFFLIFLLVSCQNTGQEINNDPNRVIEDVTQHCSEQIYKSEINRVKVNYFPKSGLVLSSFWKKGKFDENGEYFFHVYPEDINDLPKNRRRYKFFNKPKTSQGFIKIKEPYFYSGQYIYPQISTKRIELGQFLNGKKTWKAIWEPLRDRDTIDYKEKKEGVMGVAPLIKLNKSDLTLFLDIKSNDLIVRGGIVAECTPDSLYLHCADASNVLRGHTFKINRDKLLSKSINYSISLPRGTNEIRFDSFKGKEKVETKTVNLCHILYAQNITALNKGEFIRSLIESNLKQLTNFKETDLRVFRLPKSKRLYVVAGEDVESFDFSVLDTLGFGYNHKTKLDSLVIDEKNDYLKLYRIDL